MTNSFYIKLLPTYSLLSMSALCICLSACSFKTQTETAQEPSLKDGFLRNGTLVLSHSLPSKPDSSSSDLDVGKQAKGSKSQNFAPLIGYFPPGASYLPADNETWIEIQKDTKKILIYKGKSPIKELQGEGSVNLEPGDYLLQHKQKRPLWYANDEYFQKRKLKVPPAGDHLRYRRGALGRYALYPTTTFPIHSGPVWSEDVGGLRVSDADLSAIFFMLQVGAPIVVK